MHEFTGHYKKVNKTSMHTQKKNFQLEYKGRKKGHGIEVLKSITILLWFNVSSFSTSYHVTSS